MQGESWNSLDIAKLALSVLTPVSVAVLGYFLVKGSSDLSNYSGLTKKLLKKGYRYTMRLLQN